MIAGKTESEILSMTNQIRHLWYKIIFLDEKEEAMKIVDSEMRIKINNV